MFDFVKNIFKDSKKAEMRPELKEIKKLIDETADLNRFDYDQEMTNLVSVLQKHFRKVRDDQMRIDRDEYADKEEDLKKRYSEIHMGYIKALQKEIAIAMNAHDQQNVLIVLGRIEEEFKKINSEVAENGRKN